MPSATAAAITTLFDEAQAEQAFGHTIARYYFGTVGGVALLAAVVFGLLPAQLAPAARAELVLACGALCALCLASMGSRDHARTEARVVASGLAALATIALAAVLLDWGIAGPAVGFLGLLTCMVCALVGRRAGVLVAGLAALVVVGLAYAQQRQWLAPANAPPAGASLWLQATLQVALIGAGLTAGLLTWRVVSRQLRSAEQREQRFRGLLTIAADAYWELDERHRLVTLSLPRRGSAVAPEAGGTIGKLPWELPQLSIDADTLDLLRAQVEAREPFRDLAVQWLTPSGQPRHFLISGEPRYGARRVFRGYWGVSRDVSAEVNARQALRATESRYLELFSRIPTPLVLHANARVLDANPAALAMFGFADLTSMVGQDLLAVYEAGDSRERARADIDTLQRMQAGGELPVAEYRLAERDGRRALVRASAVRLDTPDGVAALSIFVDDTERRRAEDAVRRSEALLSHLLASSPDVITLSELATGRYALVNRSFERVSGFSAAEVVGRSAVEMGLWHAPQDRQRFIAAVRRDGHVQDMPTRFVTKGGGLLAMRISGARFTMDRREYLVINARDVTEAEAERLQREAILHNASVGIAVTRERCFVLANPRFEQLYGWPPGALLGQSGRVVWDSDDEYHGLRDLLGPVLARGEAVEIETRARRHDLDRRRHHRAASG